MALKNLPMSTIPKGSLRIFKLPELELNTQIVTSAPPVNSLGDCIPKKRFSIKPFYKNLLSSEIIFQKSYQKPKTKKRVKK
jgi:hypothetical protein